MGLAAAAGGNWDVAEGHFRSALAFVDEVGDRLGKPAVQKWYAWMLLRRAAPGDRDQARVLLDEAVPPFQIRWCGAYARSGIPSSRRCMSRPITNGPTNV